MKFFQTEYNNSYSGKAEAAASENWGNVHALNADQNNAPAFKSLPSLTPKM